MPNYTRFFQNLSSQQPQKLNAFKAVSAGVAFTTYGYCYIENEKRFVQTFFNHYIDTTLTPDEKHRYNTDSNYKKSINNDFRHAYRMSQYDISYTSLRSSSLSPIE